MGGPGNLGAGKRLMVFLGSFLGRCLLSASAVFGVIFWFAAHERNVGAEHVVEHSRKEGAKINAKNDALRARNPIDGAALRLRREYCRDC